MTDRLLSAFEAARPSVLLMSLYCCRRPNWIHWVPLRSLRLFVKAAVQVLLLSYCLFFKLPKPDTVLVQNPPAIPTLFLCVLACWWHKAKLVIDWHNFGYTLMALSMGRRHPLVCKNLLQVLPCLPGYLLIICLRLIKSTGGSLTNCMPAQSWFQVCSNMLIVVFYKLLPKIWQTSFVTEQMTVVFMFFIMQVIVAQWCEQFFGRQATMHLCVSKAMQLFLEAEWAITATVFYDTPPTWFHKASLQEKHDLFTRVAADLTAPMHGNDLAYSLKSPYSQRCFDVVHDQSKEAKADGLLKTDHNVFTHLVDAEPQMKAVRPALLVSSTSWTEDEDFGILLHAALQYDQEVCLGTGVHTYSVP